jgi:hypothetical protein
MKVSSFCKLFALLVVVAFVFSPAFACSSFCNITADILVNGKTDISELNPEWNVSAVESSSVRAAISYTNETDSKNYGTFVYWGGPSGWPVTFDIPFHVFTNDDYSEATCSSMGLDYCINITDLDGLTFTNNFWVAFVPGLVFTVDGKQMAYDYSIYWSAPPVTWNFDHNYKMNASLPVFKSLKLYRNGGKIAGVLKGLSTTPSIWFGGSVDEFIDFQFASNGTSVACYGETDEGMSGFCGSGVVTGNATVVNSGGSDYVVFTGDDFTDGSTQYVPHVALLSSNGENQAYLDDDGNAATLNFAAFYSSAFYQSDVVETSCDLSSSFPSDTGGCISFVPSIPTGNFIGFDQAFISGIAGLAMILVALATAVDYTTGGHVVKSINKHFSDIGKQIK